MGHNNTCYMIQDLRVSAQAYHPPPSLPSSNPPSSLLILFDGFVGLVSLPSDLSCLSPTLASVGTPLFLLIGSRGVSGRLQPLSNKLAFFIGVQLRDVVEPGRGLNAANTAKHSQKPLTRLCRGSHSRHLRGRFCCYCCYHAAAVQLQAGCSCITRRSPRCLVIAFCCSSRPRTPWLRPSPGTTSWIARRFEI